MAERVIIPKGRKIKPKKYVLIQYWEREGGRITRALGDVIYTDIDKARGQILKDFMESRTNLPDIEMGDEIESSNCIEIPVFSPDRRPGYINYEFSYFITKIY